MNKPTVSDHRKADGSRSAAVENIHEVQGTDGYRLYDPDNPPFEVSDRGDGGSLRLNEVEAREIHRRLGEIIGEWDAGAVRAFSKRRPRYSVEHVVMIARESGLSGIPFCAECADWHTPDEEHSLDEE